MKIPLLLFLSILLSGLRAVYADTPLTAKVDKRVESLVRVSVIRYLLNHGDTTAATRQVKQDIAQGFPWMSKLSRLLTTYEKQRNAYPTMESFMPRIVKEMQPEVLGQQFDNACTMTLSIRRSRSQQLLERLRNVESMSIDLK